MKPKEFASRPVQRLTVAMPVYNEQDRVGRALEELLKVPFPLELEVIVVDDGSSDGTQAILRDFADRVRVMRHDRNRGKGAALRTALAEATGEILVPFDADLEYDPVDLPRLVAPICDGRTE